MTKKEQLIGTRWSNKEDTTLKEYVQQYGNYYHHYYYYYFYHYHLMMTWSTTTSTIITTNTIGTDKEAFKTIASLMGNKRTPLNVENRFNNVLQKGLVKGMIN